MYFPRASGILLHPTSLPGRFPIGDLGEEAYRFVYQLAASGQTYWQILPLGPTGPGDSPYSAYSAFAGNTYLISLEKLVWDGLISEDEIDQAPESPDRVDYGKTFEWKPALLTRVFEKFRSTQDSDVKAEFEYFAHTNAWWLDDYAAFRAIKTSYDNKPWYEWAEPLRLRDSEALDKIESQLGREIEAEKFSQYLFFRQWLTLRDYAHRQGIKIIGDIPIFVALDSADVWCNQSKFKLNEDGTPKVVAGVPPDYFSKTGQLWGNPIYDWDAMRREEFGWWTARISFNLMTVDLVRLDHFIGFGRNWEVPAKDETAENGKWAEVPGQEFFSVLKSKLGELPVIAEDLGAMTPEIERLRDAFGFPGMRILHNAFGGDAYNRDLPHNYRSNCVAYTGTHDNDTTIGWFKSAPKNVKKHCRQYLQSNGREINWDLIRAVIGSVADTAIFPMQDVLGLGSDSRMNTPATGAGNWQWRMKVEDLNDDTFDRLAELTDLYGRRRH